MEFLLHELDFRYADEDDALDIALLVNRSLQHEHTGNESFRKEGNRVTAEEIESNCYSASTRWIVLETPRPEELLVAAARLVISRKDNRFHVLVDIFGTADSNAIREMLLIRLEAICRSQGWNHVTFEVPSWSESIHNWLSSHGYEDLGGRTWPAEQQEVLLKPTMILEFQKNLDTAQPSGAPSTKLNLMNNIQHSHDDIDSHAAATHNDNNDDDDDDDDNVDIGNLQIINEGIDLPVDGNDPMKGLIADLFRALHAENTKL